MDVVVVSHRFDPRFLFGVRDRIGVAHPGTDTRVVSKSLQKFRIRRFDGA
jgi:hypothetical protein